MSETKQRFRKERLDAVLASARECPGAEVEIDMVTGKARIVFPAIMTSGPPLASAEEEALRAEEAMIAAMGGKR